MKLLRLLLFGATALWCAPALAQVPAHIHQEGLLLDARGDGVPGPVELRFSLYTVAVGGVALWTETFDNVELVEGYYSVILGEQRALDADTLLRARHMGVTIGGAAELRPRVRLVSVPFAMVAGSVSGGPVDATEVRIAGNLVVDGGGQWVGDPTGLIGPAGPAGAAGPPGPPGQGGAAGSPDTPAQVLAKLVQVDGAGSGLDADLLDGRSSDRFMRTDGNTGTTGDLRVDGTTTTARLIAGQLQVNGLLDMTNHGLNAVDSLQINDPGPDGRIYWGESQAVIYVAPLDDANADGPLRLRNPLGLSLEGNVRTTGHLRLEGAAPVLSWAGAQGDCCYEAIALANRDLRGANSIHIADPGPSEGLFWDGSQARIFVAPLDNANTDGLLRLVNDEAISLEANVRTTGNVRLEGTRPSLSWAGAAGDCCYEAIALANRNIGGVNAIHISDPGEGEGLIFDGSQARIVVSPLDGSNADGYLRLVNDEGISLESDVRTTGRLTVAGRAGIGTSSPETILDVRDDSAVETGIRLRNLRAGVNTRPYLRLEGLTARNQGTWAMLRGLSGAEAGGDDAQNHGGLQILVSTGGAGAANPAMTVEHNGNVGVGTTDPLNILHVARDGHVNAIFDRTDTSDHLTAVVGSNGSGLRFSDSNYFFVGTQPYAERNDNSAGRELFRIENSGAAAFRGPLELTGPFTRRLSNIVVRKGLFTFVHPPGGYAAGQEWAARYYHIRTPEVRRNSEMYRYDATGYSYGIGHPLSFTWVGYLYGGSGVLHQSSAHNNTNNGVGVTQYIGSDDHVYLKFGPISQYYNSFVLDYQSGSTGERSDHSTAEYRVVLTANDAQL